MGAQTSGPRPPFGGRSQGVRGAGEPRGTRHEAPSRRAPSGLGGLGHRTRLLHVGVGVPCRLRPPRLALPASHPPEEACLPRFKHFLIICNFVRGIKDKRNLEGNWIYI